MLITTWTSIDPYTGMNNNYSMSSRYENHLGRQGSSWKSDSGGPVKNNHNVKFRPHVDFIPVEREELRPELRGSYYSRIPPLSPRTRRYGHSADELSLPRSDASRQFDHYHKRNSIPSEIPSGSSKYQAKDGLLLDNHDRPAYNVKDHYSNGPFFQDVRDRSEIPLHDSRSSIPPHRHRVLPYNDQDRHVKRTEATPVHPDRPRNRIRPDNRHEHKSFHDRRPHSHESLPVNGHRLRNTFTHKVGASRDSPWGDMELWELDNTKRYNSLPALSERKRLDPNLLLPYDSYRGDWPMDTKQWKQQSIFWDSHLHPSYLRYLADPQNAESFIERFVESCIQESLVLEVAAEVLVESRELQELLDRTSKPVILAAKDVLNEFLDEELLNIVKEERQISVVQFWQDVAGKLDIIEPVRDELVAETVKEELKFVAADAVSELVDDYFTEKQVVTIYNALYEDATGGLLPGVVKETLLDLCVESLIDDFIDEEIQDCGSSFVADVYSKGRPQLPLSNRQRDREALQVQQKSEEIAPDALILDVLFRNLKNRNQVWTDVEYKDKLLDGLILDQLLNQNLKLQEAVEATQENIPIKQFHDDTAYEEGLNTLLDNELITLDEDMSLLDQAEMELESLMYSTTTTPAYLHQATKEVPHLLPHSGL